MKLRGSVFGAYILLGVFFRYLLAFGGLRMLWFVGAFLLWFLWKNNIGGALTYSWKEFLTGDPQKSVFKLSNGALSFQYIFALLLGFMIGGVLLLWT